VVNILANHELNSGGGFAIGVIAPQSVCKDQATLPAEPGFVHLPVRATGGIDASNRSRYAPAFAAAIPLERDCSPICPWTSPPTRRSPAFGFWT
jgi:hypothetical protein